MQNISVSHCQPEKADKKNITGEPKKLLTENAAELKIWSSDCMFIVTNNSERVQTAGCSYDLHCATVWHNKKKCQPKQLVSVRIVNVFQGVTILHAKGANPIARALVL